eukprot:Amastigsp_a854704_5.p2 type:complete len:141 gc:universal Amastigsp_a854704_5:295-717(+)
MSAPMTRAAATSDPVEMQPAKRIVPLKKLRSSASSANGDRVPACPPAPAQTAMSPSTPAAAAFRAWRTEITSWKTTPPYEWICATRSGTAPSEVMTSGTRCLTVTARSASRRGFDLCTMRFTPKGALRSGALSIWFSHCS